MKSRVRKGCVISILLLIKKKTKFCKQQKIGGFEYFGDSDVVNKLQMDRASILFC